MPNVYINSHKKIFESILFLYSGNAFFTVVDIYLRGSSFYKEEYFCLMLDEFSIDTMKTFSRVVVPLCEAPVNIMQVLNSASSLQTLKETITYIRYHALLALKKPWEFVLNNTDRIRCMLNPQLVLRSEPVMESPTKKSKISYAGSYNELGFFEGSSAPDSEQRTLKEKSVSELSNISNGINKNQ